jgi:hypothetical protein
MHLFFLGMTPCHWVLSSWRFKTTTLSWNIKNQLLSDVASYPRRMGVSATLLRKPKNSISFFFVLCFSLSYGFLGNETKWDFYDVSVLNSRTTDQFCHHPSALPALCYVIRALAYIIHKLKILRQLQSKHTRISTLCIHYLTFSGVFA